MVTDTTTMEAPAPRPRTTGRRQPSVEMLRFVCACAVVADHMSGGLDPDRPVSPLVPFLILFGVYSVRSLRGGDRQRFLGARARRALPAWIAASAFYLALEFWMNPGWPGPLAAFADPFVWLEGPTIHLWFLPFILVVSLPIALIVPLVRDRRAVFLLAAALAPLAIAAAHLHHSEHLPDPIGQWVYSLPAIFYGVVAALAMRHDARIASAAFLAVAAGGSLVLGDLGEPMQLLCGALLCEAAWRIDLRADWMVALGDLSFGVYLIHPFFILVVDKFFADAGFWGAWALVAGLSVAAVLVARRLPLVRELI